MERATKEQLMTPHLPSEEVPIEGVGLVLCRALSRWEMVETGKLEDDRQRQDNKAIFFGMLEPKMNEDEIMAWRKAGRAMEIEEIARAINRLSGIGKDAAKSDVPPDGERPVD